MSKIRQGVLCLLLGFFWSAPKTVFAQFKVHPDSSFYTFLDSFYHYHQDDSTEGGIYNHVRRDVMTWGTRLAPSGNMSNATQAMTAYTSAYKNVGGVASATGIVLPPVYSSVIPWKELGPFVEPTGSNQGRGVGQIHRIAFHPQYNGGSNQTLYAGSHFGGLYRSDNAGDTWYNYHTDRELSLTSVSGVAVSSNRVFVCTGSGDYGYSQFGQQAHYEPLRGGLNNISLLYTQGVYYNIVGTTTWQHMNGNNVTMIDGSTVSDLLTVFQNGGTMREILVHPTNDNILLIATSQGVFRTTNRGATWQQVLVGAVDPAGGYFLDTEWRGLNFHPTNPNVVYASGREVYQSTDGGSTWNTMNATPPIHCPIQRINIATTAASSNDLYAFVIADTASYSGVYLYQNNSWSLFGAFNTDNPDWAGIAVAFSEDSIVHVGAVQRTGFRPNSARTGLIDYSIRILHDDIHVLVYPPHADSILFAGTHGGVEIWNRYTGVRERKYNGLGVSTIWSFDDWEGNDSVLITAHQDNGVVQTSNAGQLWRAGPPPQDGFGAKIDDHTGTFYIKYNSYAGLYRSSSRYPTAIDPELITPTGMLPSIVPLDYGLFGTTARIPNTFPMVNHPKTEAAYMGLSELYRRDYEVYEYDGSVAFSTIDSLLQGADFYTDTALLTRPGIAAQNADGASCVDLGGTVVRVAPNFVYRPLHLTGFSIDRWRRDTICRLIPKGAYLNYMMPLKSDLKKHNPSDWNRRILEIAFSEDDSTNYTYLATLGDTRSNRRCDFYVNNANSMGCDTCFNIKTANIPVDPNGTTGDPNPITGIAVDPLNGQRVWISLSGYGSAYKVYHSPNAGDTWVSWDDADGSLAGLNLPINHMVYQRGTNDRLYIATDAGIYVREGQGNWLRYGEEFPNVRVTELKINYCVGKLRAATFGRGMWEADLLPAEDNSTFRSFRSVDANETWTTNKNMSRDIRVKAGVTLTLNNMTLNMPKNGLIVVEPGGQLVVDSSTITNLCGQTWEGIEVWGATQNSQAPYNQGFLYITNSTVEHAREAVRLWKVGDYPNATSTTGGTGGIVLAGNTQFLNNWRSAEFMKYRSTNRYLSEFSDCTFEVNEDMRQDFLGHISAWDVGGLQIKGCDFRDTRNQKQDDAYGILTLSASVQLTAWQNGGNFQRNSFEGLSRGVVLGGTPNQFSTVVDQTDFMDNNRGVIVRASGGLRVLRNTFTIGGYDNSYTAAQPYGVSILRQGDFVAQQNDFVEASSTPSSRPSVGFWVDDLGSGFNRIRNNTFTNLSIANLVHGNNGRDNNNQFGGLSYFCNGQTGNAFDLTVNRAYQAPTGAAIATDQGDNNQPAYNSFSYPLNNSFGFDWHMSNDASLIGRINYWTPPNPVQTEQPIDTININVLRASGIGALGFCNLTYTNLGTFKPLSDNNDLATLSDLKTEYYQTWEAYQQLRQNYQNNPTSTTLPSEIGGKGQVLTSKANEVIFYYRNDTATSNCDSIAIWIGQKIGLQAEYELVEHYWSCQQYILALNHLSTITDQYILEEAVLDNHQDYIAFLNILYGAYQADRTEATLTKDEVILLNELAENNYGFAAMKAANIVNFFYNDNYRYHPTLPEGSKKSAQESLITVNKGNLAIYPNPTTTWADINYKLPKELEKGKLVVTSTSGQQILTLELSQQQGILTLNTQKWLTGTYFVVLYAEDKAIEQTRLIIR
ncbi:MAG: T9SS type A sorting domain-containing protein [Aureispira sp.]